MFHKKLLFTKEIDRASKPYTHRIVLPARNVFDKMMFMPEQNSHYHIWDKKKSVHVWHVTLLAVNNILKLI